MKVFGELGTKVVGFVLTLIIASDLVESGVQESAKCVLEREKHGTTFAVGTRCVSEFAVQFGSF